MISNSDEFLKGNYSTCLTLMDERMSKLMSEKGNDPYINCGEIDLDINISGETVTAHVLKILDAEIEREQAEHSLKMDLLQTRKDELLALTHEPNPAADFERDGDA
jgi:hypothetical protein